MGIFESGRSEGFPSIYSAHHTPVTVDVTEVIFITIFVIIAIAFVSIIPSYRKRKIGFSIVIGCLLIIENFGQEWEYGCTKSKTPYRAGEGQEIEAEMAVKIGLRSVNITLKAKPEEGTPLAKETINYNERFPWTWDQGRIGFGPYGMEFALLTAFACWLLANIFLQSVIRYTAYLTGVIGCLQLLTCIVWVLVHNPTPLAIPFEHGTIRMAFGLHFWMTFGCGD
ncbi:hypothetical protein DMN91_011024 [Ooceraea biroi]|uniref:Dual oxidase maturation factor n=1 Tax=Ooceraea biroi TaxID=2015173 RepID=A0A3L8D8W2_OOCBI|nr:hypothetical protein DMN91_011024 [Ooceraea biroi]